jgi:hypothetical protein
MADNTLPPSGLSGVEQDGSPERRAFLRRAVGIGVPVVLATIPGRTVLAQTNTIGASGGGASIHLSGWRARNEDAIDQFCTEPGEQLIDETDQLKKAGGSASEATDPIGANKAHGKSNSQVNPGQ